MYLPLAQRQAIRAALPYQSDFPSCAFSDARRDYAAARGRELAKLRDARTIEGRTYATFIGDTRRYLANIRAARSALRKLEG